jgi:hypothetical protein
VGGHQPQHQACVGPTPHCPDSVQPYMKDHVPSKPVLPQRPTPMRSDHRDTEKAISATSVNADHRRTRWRTIRTGAASPYGLLRTRTRQADPETNVRSLPANVPLVAARGPTESAGSPVRSVVPDGLCRLLASGAPRSANERSRPRTPIGRWCGGRWILKFPHLLWTLRRGLHRGTHCREVHTGSVN